MNLPSKIVKVAIERLIPYARNARTHSPGQVAAIAGSLREFGWTNPVLIDADGGIVAGHGRVLAARQLGLTEIPCIELKHLTEVQRRAYVLADNQLALNGSGWDTELLKLELTELKLADFNLDLAGFDAPALADLQIDLDAPGGGAGAGMGDGDTEPDIDRAEELRVKWGVEPGDLWAMGDHRLLCGDSTKAEDVTRLMQGEKADLCFTSPPYGQQRDYRDGATEKVSDWDTLMQGVFGNLPMSEAGQVLVNLGLIHRDNEWIPYWDGWIQWMRQQGWRRFGWYVWDKINCPPRANEGRMRTPYEWVFHFNKKAVPCIEWEPCKNAGDDRGDTIQRGKNGKVLDIKTPGKVKEFQTPDGIIRVIATGKAGTIHPAIFPVELPENFIKTWPGLIYEPFSGSGTTIIAGENLGRKVRACEISPAYVAVALERYHQHTQKTPVKV